MVATTTISGSFKSLRHGEGDVNLGKLRAVGYGWLIVQSLLALVAPKRYYRFLLAPYRFAFQNVEDVEPKPWLIRTTRISGIGMLVTGIVGVLVEVAGPELESDPELADVLPEDPGGRVGTSLSDRLPAVSRERIPFVGGDENDDDAGDE